jgi:hypothetical protein
MKLSIDLGDLVPSDESLSTPTFDPLTEKMLQALESPNGISIPFGSDAIATSARFRYYKRIKRHRREGNLTFDKLTFIIEGGNLIIKSVPDPEAIVL